MGAHSRRTVPSARKMLVLASVTDSLVTFATRKGRSVRPYIPSPAGIARMNLTRFTVATAIGGGFLAVVWALVGKAVGHNWTKWKHALGYVDYAVVGLLALVAAYFIVR